MNDKETPEQQNEPAEAAEKLDKDCERPYNRGKGSDDQPPGPKGSDDQPPGKKGSDDQPPGRH